MLSTMLSFQSPVVTPCDNPPATPFTRAELTPLIFIPPVIVPAAIFIPADVQVFLLQGVLLKGGGIFFTCITADFIFVLTFTR
jgi:hypothetical protein